MPFDAVQGTGLEDRPRLQQYGARTVSNLVGAYRIRPPHAFEPGCPSTPLRVQDWRIDKDCSKIGARKESNLVGVYRIHPPHAFEPGCPSTPLRVQD